MKLGVLILRDLNIPGGTANRVKGLLNNLPSGEHEYVLFSKRMPEHAENRFKYIHFDYGRISRSLLLTNAVFPHPLVHPIDGLKYIRTIKRERVDILHCHKLSANHVGVSLQKRLNIPFVFDIHGIVNIQKESLKEENFIDRARNYLFLNSEIKMFNRADGVFAVSDRMKQFIVENYHIDPCKVYVVRDGVDVDFFQCNVPDSDLESIRQKDQLFDRKIILFAGSLWWECGIQDLLESFRILNEIYKDLLLIVIGYGEHFHYLENFRKKTGLNNILIKGYVPSSTVRIYQRLANVLVVPLRLTVSNELVTTIKLLESLASGKPVVATRLAGISDVIRDGYNGILVDHNNPMSLAQGIERVLNNSEKDNGELGINGLRTVRHNYSWKISAEAALEAYVEILERRNRS